MGKVVIPAEIAEWVENSKEDVVDYERNFIKTWGCDDEEILEVIHQKSLKCGINQFNIFKCLIDNGDCGIDAWMKETSNSFEIVSKALIEGYEVEGSIEEC